MKSVYVVYTRWKNLKKTSDMVDGQVGFHRPKNVRRLQVEKDNAIVNALNKTKKELYPDLYQLQQDRLREIQQENKEKRRLEIKAKKKAEQEARRQKEERSYDRMMNSDNMTSTTGEQMKVACPWDGTKSPNEFSCLIRGNLSIYPFIHSFTSLNHKKPHTIRNTAILRHWNHRGRWNGRCDRCRGIRG